jgi:hypothetical protein
LGLRKKRRGPGERFAIARDRLEEQALGRIQIFRGASRQIGPSTTAPDGQHEWNQTGQQAGKGRETHAAMVTRRMSDLGLPSAIPVPEGAQI